MSEKKLEKRQIPPFVVMWLVSGILSIADWFALRAAVSAVAAAIAGSVSIEAQMQRNWFVRWPAAAADKFAVVCFGILAVLSIMAFEWIYRDALLKDEGRKRFLTIAGIQVGLIVFSVIAVTVASWVAG